MTVAVLFLPLEFCNLGICYTLWDKTKGNVKKKSAVWPNYFARDKFGTFEKWSFERKKPPRRTFFIFRSLRVVRAHKNNLPILINVNLHVVNRVGPLSTFANCISNPTLSVAQPKIELEGLN